MSLLDPKPPRKRKPVAAVLCAASVAGLLISIGLCGSHSSGWNSDGPDQHWLSVGIGLFVCSIGGFLLSFIVAVVESQRGDE